MAKPKITPCICVTLLMDCIPDVSAAYHQQTSDLSLLSAQAVPAEVAIDTTFISHAGTSVSPYVLSPKHSTLPLFLRTQPNHSAPTATSRTSVIPLGILKRGRQEIPPADVTPHIPSPPLPRCSTGSGNEYP